MIPVAKPSITDLEKKYVAQVMEEGFISNGEWVNKFENKWAEWNGYKYGVACSSGTAALFLALKALGIGKGDEVIVPEFTMAATAWAVTYTGAKPVFVDCGDDLNINVDRIEERITEKTKAIIPVPIYGRPCNMEIIRYLSRRHRIFVVEDMAEAHGMKPQSDIACFSFQGNKIISTGEGGMCLTNDEAWAKEMRQLLTLYFDKDRTLIHEKIGYNYKMTNMQAAIGLAQAERIGEILPKRRHLVDLYDQAMMEAGLTDCVMPERETPWVYDVKFSDWTIRDAVKIKLLERGVESRYFFRPMSEQPMYQDESFPWLNRLKAYKWSKVGLYLPLFTDMTKEDVHTVVSTLKEAMVELGQI